MAIAPEYTPGVWYSCEEDDGDETCRKCGNPDYRYYRRDSYRSMAGDYWCLECIEKYDSLENIEGERP